MWEGGCRGVLASLSLFLRFLLLGFLHLLFVVPSCASFSARQIHIFLRFLLLEKEGPLMEVAATTIYFPLPRFSAASSMGAVSKEQKMRDTHGLANHPPCIARSSSSSAALVSKQGAAKRHSGDISRDLYLQVNYDRDVSLLARTSLPSVPCISTVVVIAPPNTVVCYQAHRPNMAGAAQLQTAGAFPVFSSVQYLEQNMSLDLTVLVTQSPPAKPIGNEITPPL